jgi:sugar transferase (PEP-CTERM/EpsH1 system associated)
LIAHVVYKFDTGGLENGLVNLLNHMPGERYRHAIVALTEVTSFRERVTRDDVGFIALNKAPGHGIKLLPRLTRLFRELRPAIVHTRNLAALEAVLPAWIARVPCRVHGEHGWDIGDLDGSRRTYRLARRAYRPFVTRYVTVSRGLERYLTSSIGVKPAHVVRIVNGVDVTRFRPSERKLPAGWPFDPAAHWVIGTVGRLQPVKNQVLLAEAFVRLLEQLPLARQRVRLAIVGAGPLRADIETVLERAQARDLAWLPGERSDVVDLLQALDVFVLPSLAEGISNTVLEAMASGLPVVATNVGGNSELVEPDRTGLLVPVDADALAAALLRYARDPETARSAGREGRRRAEQFYSLDAMVAQYLALYDRLLATGGAATDQHLPALSNHATTGAE